MADSPRLSLQGIHKRFDNTVALGGVDLDLLPGEVLGLIGENGAGKSTLARIIAGVHQPDAGAIEVDNERRAIPDVRTAQTLGIAVVHQELNLVPHLSVESNILLGREPWRVPLLKLSDRKALRERATEMLELVGLDVDPGTLVMHLSIAAQQRVEIARALSLNARILIMDEPTSSLSTGDADALLQIVASLRHQGISVIYISHKLDEVLRISDRIAVFRDGLKVAEIRSSEATQDQLVTAMVGRELSTLFPDRPRSLGEVILRVDDLLAYGIAEPVSFEVRSGEVLGIAGLVGAGRTELLRAIFGASRRRAGRVSVLGQPVGNSPAEAMRAGIGFVPEDRKSEGLHLPLSLRDNITLAVLRNLARGMFRRESRECSVADSFIGQLDVHAASREQPVVSLSGGNQQKVLLAKWLAIEPKVLLLDEPTRGIDVGAKQEVYRLIARIAESGVAVVVVSSEMEEIIGLSHRALVMREGRPAGELPGDRLCEEEIMALAAQKA